MSYPHEYDIIADMNICHACNKEPSIGKRIGRRDVCSFCGADLFCCLNCRFHDRFAPKQCKEPNAELVKEKAKANFCDYFVFAESRGAGGSDAAGARARETLGALFKK